MMTATEPVAAQPKGHKKRNAKKGKKASVAAVEEPLVKAEESADAQVESQDKAEEASAIQGIQIIIFESYDFKFF